MNYLELVNDFMVETGMEDPITAIAGQIDDGLKAATWIKDAWLQIQRAEDWSFRWAEDSFNTVASQAGYTLAQQGLTAGDKIDRTSLKIVADSHRLNYVNYVDLEFETTEGKPARFGIKPDRSLLLNAIPDAVYQIDFAYHAAAVTLSADADTPSMDAEYHKAIVWLAVRNYAREQGKEWIGLYRSSNSDFNQIYSDMLNTFLPQWEGKIPLQE